MDQVTIRQGATVYGADGEKLGKVVALQGQTLVVEKGFLFHTDFPIPINCVNTATENEVYLTVSKDRAINGDWGTTPTTLASTTSTPLSSAPTAAPSASAPTPSAATASAAGADVLTRERAAGMATPVESIDDQERVRADEPGERVGHSPPRATDATARPETWPEGQTTDSDTATW